MKAIVAVDNNWGIGSEGKLLAYIAEDLRNFKKVTMGCSLVYGRKTLATFPKGQALPNRKNIMLSSASGLKIENILVMGSVEEVLTYEKESNEEIMVIGGESVYRQFLPYLDKVYVTHIDKEFKNVDSYFPDLSKQGEWKEKSFTDWMIDEKTGLSYRFSCYVRLDEGRG